MPELKPRVLCNDENMLDETDVVLVGALFFDPRATFDALGHVAGVSASTASRRLRRLVESRTIRVVGEVSWHLFSQTYPVHAWISVSGREYSAVAREVAQLPEAQHVASLYGREPVFATLHGQNDIDTVRVIDQIHCIDGVSAVYTLPVLQWAVKASGWNPMLLEGEHLERAQAILPLNGPPHLPQITATSELPRTKAEVMALSALQQDGRLTATELSGVIGASIPTAQRLINRLIDDGWFRPRVECNLAAIGMGCKFLVRVQSDPQHTESVLCEFSPHPANRFVTQIAGDSDVFATGVCRNRHELTTILNHDFAAISGLKATQTNIIARDWKRYWTSIDEDGNLGEFTPPALWPAS